MEELTITKRLEKEPEKTLREYGQPTIHAIRSIYVSLMLILKNLKLILD
jgi:hypothetical protein